MADPIHLYLDEDAQRTSLVRALRARQIDVLTVKKNAVGRGACPAELDAALGGSSPQLFPVFLAERTMLCIVDCC